MEPEEILAKIVFSEYRTIESFMLYDMHAVKQITNIFSDPSKKDIIIKKIRALTNSLNGVPRLIISSPSDKKKIYDTYIHSIINELIESYYKVRKTIVRQEMKYIIQEHIKTIVENKPPTDIREMVNENYLESLEDSYIRIASFWDRAGQIIDYAFFNIRKYENDTFTSVMERLKSNYYEVLENLKTNLAYMEISSYAKSENNEGLMKIFHRRNILIHSIGFSIHDENRFDLELYDSVYNHFEDKKRRKLNKIDVSKERTIILYHYNKLCNLFPAIIDLAYFGSCNSMKNRKS